MVLQKSDCRFLVNFPLLMFVFCSLVSFYSFFLFQLLKFSLHCLFSCCSNELNWLSEPLGSLNIFTLPHSFILKKLTVTWYQVHIRTWDFRPLFAYRHISQLISAWKKWKFWWRAIKSHSDMILVEISGWDLILFLRGHLRSCPAYPSRRQTCK
jgi:hypothetical protein